MSPDVEVGDVGGAVVMLTLLMLFGPSQVAAQGREVECLMIPTLVGVVEGMVMFPLCPWSSSRLSTCSWRVALLLVHQLCQSKNHLQWAAIVAVDDFAAAVPVHVVGGGRRFVVDVVGTDYWIQSKCCRLRLPI
jgi:hypothetical protein